MICQEPMTPWWFACWRRLFPASIFILFTAAVGHASEPALTLDYAVSQTLAEHPDLQVFDVRLQGLEGGRLTADLSPAYDAGLDVENLLGSGDSQGVEAVEYTLSLSSVIELGDKRLARTEVANARFDLMEAERRANTLDLLGQVTQGFVATLALQEKLTLAADAVALAQTTHDIVARRVSRGAAPDAEALRARSALAQSRIAQTRLQSEYDSRKVALAALWGVTAVSVPPLVGDLYRFGTTDSFEALYRQASDNPMIQVYASEERIRAAEVQLARSQSQGDIRWQVGVRRQEESGDSALVAGLSMPLFAAQRNRGEVQSALAARNEVEYRQRAALLLLHGRLFEAWRTRQQSIEAVQHIRAEILPDLVKALELTQAAYESGRYSYVEWVDARQELLQAREALVDAAATALLNQTLIEQLTAQPMAVSQSAAALTRNDRN